MGFVITPGKELASGLGSVVVSDEVAANMATALDTQGDTLKKWDVRLDTPDEAADVLAQMRRWAADNGVRFRIVKGTQTETSFSFRIEGEDAANQRLEADRAARAEAKAKTSPAKGKRGK